MQRDGYGTEQLAFLGLHIPPGWQFWWFILPQSRDEPRHEDWCS